MSATVQQMVVDDLKHRQLLIIKQMKNIESLWIEDNPTKASQKTYQRLQETNRCIERVLLDVYGAFL